MTRTVPYGPLSIQVGNSHNIRPSVANIIVLSMKLVSYLSVSEYLPTFTHLSKLRKEIINDRWFILITQIKGFGRQTRRKWNESSKIPSGACLQRFAPILLNLFKILTIFYPRQEGAHIYTCTQHMVYWNLRQTNIRQR